MTPGAYPHLTEFAVNHVMKPGYAFASEFKFGLELILDALESRSINSSKKRRPGPIGELALVVWMVFRGGRGRPEQARVATS